LALVVFTGVGPPCAAVRATCPTATRIRIACVVAAPAGVVVALVGAIIAAWTLSEFVDPRAVVEGGVVLGEFLVGLVVVVASRQPVHSHFQVP
jgi:hypothetical protein